MSVTGSEAEMKFWRIMPQAVSANVAGELRSRAVVRVLKVFLRGLQWERFTARLYGGPIGSNDRIREDVPPNRRWSAA